MSLRVYGEEEQITLNRRSGRASLSGDTNEEEEEEEEEVPSLEAEEGVLKSQTKGQPNPPTGTGGGFSLTRRSGYCLT